MELFISVWLGLSFLTRPCQGQDLVATITLGAGANYFGSALTTPTGTDYDVTVVAPNPSQGVDIFLSQQKIDIMKKAVTDNCADIGSEQCQASINSALTDKSGANLQKRILPILVGAAEVANVIQAVAAAVTVLISSVVGLFVVNGINGDKKNIHLGPNDIAQLTNIKSATAIVFKTDAADAKPITVSVTVPSNAKPTGVAPSFSTAAAAENGHDKGDIILSMTGDLASQINGVLDNIICKRTKRQAGTITSCDVTGARSLLLASVAPGLLEAFRLYAGPFFQFVDKDFLTVQTQLFDWAKSINLQFDSDSQLKALAGAYLYLTISRFHSGTPIAMSNDIPASAVSPDSAPTSSESSKPCPPPDRQPMCLNCGGETTTGKCLGDPKYDNQFKDCECIQFDGSGGRPTTNTFLDVSLLLNNLPKFSPTILTSGNITCPDDEKQKLTPDLFSKISAQFCKNHDLKTEAQESLTTDKITDWKGDSSYSGYTFSWSWKKEPRRDLGSRPPNCQDMFDQLSKDKTCNLGNDQWSRTGQLYTWLGFATFAIIPPNYKQPPPAPPPVDYKKAFYVVWDVPPTTGQPFYDFFDVNAGYTTSLDNQCGSKNVPLAPKAQVNDPKLHRIDDMRKAGKSIAPADRVPPGDIGSIGFSNNCHYIENTRGAAQIKCDDTVVDCHVPDSALVEQITAKNGACGNTQNVRMLVMVCPHN